MARREEFYEELDKLGEDEVNRGLIFKRWTITSEHQWADPTLHADSTLRPRCWE